MRLAWRPKAFWTMFLVIFDRACRAPCKAPLHKTLVHHVCCGALQGAAKIVGALQGAQKRCLYGGFYFVFFLKLGP